jgi:hypothetical protein
MTHTALRRRSQRILEAAGYRVTPAEGSLYEWDLIGVNAASLVLVRVSEDQWPDEKTQENLTDQLLPRTTAKLLHRWNAGARWPEVRALP